ncbi:MAG: hypothetical protein LBD37_06260 [Treponema sp.]|jgi:hypothetical protein|nr:hypothetical protein [Treponema sp.]
MSITQTVEIPPSHRLTIDVPREVPAGPVILTFTPAPAVPSAAGKEQPAAEPAEGAQSPASHTDFSCLVDPTIPTPITDRLSGILAGAGDITHEQIREERLRKYLQ